MKAPLITELKARREALGWSVAEVGERCGIDRNSLEDWEDGVGSPGLESLLAWAGCLGLRVGLTAGSGEIRQSVRIAWDERRITVNGSPVRLTPMEWKTLELLAKARGELVTHEALFRHLYGDDQPYRPESTAIRVVITKLRRLLPLRIEARWGRGYMISGIEAPEPAPTERGGSSKAPSKNPDPAPGNPWAEKRQPATEHSMEKPAGREPGRPQAPERNAPRPGSAGEFLPPSRRQPRDCAPSPGGRSVPPIAAPAMHLNPCRAEELDVIERFLAERGVTRCPDVATIERAPLPTLVWDRNKRKWVRPPRS